MPTNIKETALARFDQEVAAARTKLLNSDRVTAAFEFKFEPPRDLTVPEDVKAKLRLPRIVMSAATYLKMLQYVLKIDVECAWHGFVTRHPNNVFAITDVKMYPHKGSGAFVESDDDRYPQWVAGLTNEQYLNCRFQAHSHVNMAVFPSGTDLQNQRDFMNDLINFVELHPEATPDELNAMNPFYIFAIMNKRQEINWILFDYVSGIMFEKEDIDFVIMWNENFTGTTLAQEIKDMPKERATYNAYSGYSTGGHQGGFIRYGQDRYEDPDDDIYPRGSHYSVSGHGGEISTYRGGTYAAGNRLPQTGVHTLVKVPDKIWEIKLSNAVDHADWLNCEFFLKYKDLLFMKKDETLNIWYYYAMDDAAGKKIPFEPFRKDPFYTSCRSCVLMEINRPAWYPPKNSKPVKKTADKKVKRIEKLFEKIDKWVLEEAKTPYLLIDAKRDKFTQINATNKYCMLQIGEFLDITFNNGDKRSCFALTKSNFIEDEHLECILLLQDAGFAFRALELDTGNEAEPSEESIIRDLGGLHS